MFRDILLAMEAVPKEPLPRTRANETLAGRPVQRNPRTRNPLGPAREAERNRARSPAKDALRGACPLVAAGRRDPFVICSTLRTRRSKHSQIACGLNPHAICEGFDRYVHKVLQILIKTRFLHTRKSRPDPHFICEGFDRHVRKMLHIAVTTRFLHTRKSGPAWPSRGGGLEGGKGFGLRRGEDVGGRVGRR